MKLTRKSSIILLAAGLAVLTMNGNSQTVDDQIQAARTTLQADRKATVAGAMQFTEQEAAAFWPLYDQYRAKMQPQGDAVLTLVKDYGQLYPNVPDDRAKVMLKDLAKFEKERVEIRSSFLKKIGKVLSPAKTLRFAQVDSRLDLATQIEIAANIPLVPVEGRLTGQGIGAAAVTEGVPGGSIVATYELTATVAAMDKAVRKLTLVDAKGISTTVKVGPEAINFDQIHVGDRLKITAAQELVVSVAGPGESLSDGATQLVALAPKGAKPGALMAETTQVTAKVTALDVERRQATLQFEDGSTRTVAVRPDVDLSKRKVGDQVVIRLTEALAISVRKP
jgi:hypothetical protein